MIYVVLFKYVSSFFFEKPRFSSIINYMKFESNAWKHMLPVIRLLLLVLSSTPLFLMVSCLSNKPRTYSDYYFSSGVPEDSGFTLYDVFARQTVTNRAAVKHSKAGSEAVDLYYGSNLVLSARTIVTPKRTYSSQTVTMKAFDLHDFSINDVVREYTTFTLGRQDIDGFLYVLTFRIIDGKFLIPDWDDEFYKMDRIERQTKKAATADKKTP
jgi:hypothetical protein